jgi:hypothetical protein
MKEDAYDVVERLSTMLVDHYVETDEAIGPRIASFAVAGEQIDSLGSQMQRIRDATATINDAYIRLGRMAEAVGASSVRANGSRTDAPAGSSVPLPGIARATGGPPAATASLQALSGMQATLAELAQTLTSEYDRFLTGTIAQLQGAPHLPPTRVPCAPCVSPKFVLLAAHARVHGPHALPFPPAGLSGIVSSKYKSYCNKIVELRRRKAQLQLIQTQKELSDLRALERTLVPPAAGTFESTLEGELVRQSRTTHLWWDCYARLDPRRQVLLFTDSKTDRITRSITSHARAVALSQYALVHELQDSYAQRPAAFEIVPKRPELPVITLASDGSMTTRRWVCALQQAIDDAGGDDESEQSGEDAGALSPPGRSTRGREQEQQGSGSAAGGSGAQADGSSGGGGFAEVLSVVPTALLPFAHKLEHWIENTSQRVDVLASQKLDEMDRQFGSTMAEQAARVETALAQLNRDRQALSEVVISALDQYERDAAEKLNSQLLAVAQAQLDYHTSAAAQMAQLCAALQATAPPPATATSHAHQSSVGGPSASPSGAVGPSSYPSNMSGPAASSPPVVAFASLVHEPEPHNPEPHQPLAQTQELPPPPVLLKRESSQNLVVVHEGHAPPIPPLSSAAAAVVSAAAPPPPIRRGSSNDLVITHEGSAPPLPSLSLSSATDIAFSPTSSSVDSPPYSPSRLAAVPEDVPSTSLNSTSPSLARPLAPAAAANFFDDGDDLPDASFAGTHAPPSTSDGLGGMAASKSGAATGGYESDDEDATQEIIE